MVISYKTNVISTKGSATMADAVTYHVRYNDADDKLQVIDHKDLEIAKKAACDFSYAHGKASIFKWVNGVVVMNMLFAKGKELGAEHIKSSIKMLPEDPAEDIPSPSSAKTQQPKESEMEVQAPSNKSMGKAPANKASVKPEKKTLRDEFELREDSLKQKVTDKLLQSKGKKVKQGDLLMAAYGNNKDENIGKLAMVLKGISLTIAKSKVLKSKLALERVKDGDDVFFTMKSL